MKRPFPKSATFRRTTSQLAIAAALCGLSSSVWALGFGRLNTSAVLGQSLNLAIPVRLEAGEDLNPACLAADVYFGDVKQLPETVQVRVEGQPGIASDRVLRVLSSTRVNEPVVTLYVIAGCQSKVTRKFVAFADPPSLVEPPVALPALEAPVIPRGGESAESPVDRSGAESGADMPRSARVQLTRPTDNGGATASGHRGKSTRHAAKARVSRDGDQLAPSRSTERPQAVAPVAVAGLDARGEHVARHGKSTRSGSRKGQGAPAANAEVARLVLDPVENDMLITPALRLSAELSPVQDDAGAAGQAVRERREAAAALWRSLNATPEQLAHDRQRLQELEARLTQLQAEGRAAQEQVKLLQVQVEQAQSQRSSSPLVFGLAGLSVALAVVLGGLVVRQRRAFRGEWWNPPVDEPSAPPPAEPPRRAPEFVPTGSGAGLSETPVASASLLKTPAASSVPAEPAPAPVAPVATPSVSTRPVPVLREVSVEELIDLEQQAEFFMVLGQDDAAIDLLEGHIESTEGCSPLPYLKLLEVYQRVGDRDAYERIRERFNARFNAHASAWDADLQQGHVLADYVGVVDRLQALWDTPERAMEVLQATLLRRAPDADPFDLPAYRELLFLYSVARDLYEHRDHAEPGRAAALSTRPVDLLLPIAEAPAEGVEPLLATRPNKVRSTRPAPLTVDVTLDDMVDPAELASRPKAALGPIDFDHLVDEPPRN